MRGISQELNTITMDGNRLADAGSAGTSRSYQFRQISSDSIERMEVVKSPTPDMDGDSIGGKIGVSINAAYRVHNTPQDTIVQAHQQLPNDVAGPAYTYSAQLVDFRNERARTGAGVKLDYRLSDNIGFKDELCRPETAPGISRLTFKAN